MNPAQPKQDQIARLSDYIENHFYSTPEQLQAVSRARQLLASTSPQPNQASLSDAVEQLIKIRSDLVSSEAGVRRREIDAYGTRIASIEQNLLLNFESERKRQYSILSILLTSLLGFLALTAFIIIRTSLQRETPLAILFFQAFTIFVSCSITYFLARLYLNAREAAERIDGKTVAIKFLRYGLRFMLEYPNNEVIVEGAVRMFLGQHGMLAKPLGDEEYRTFTGGYTSGLQRSRPDDTH